MTEKPTPHIKPALTWELTLKGTWVGSTEMETIPDMPASRRIVRIAHVYQEPSGVWNAVTWEEKGKLLEQSEHPGPEEARTWAEAQLKHFQVIES